MDSPIPTLSHMAHLVHEKLIWCLQGPVYTIGLGPSYLWLFSEHNIFTLKSVLFWMKKLCGHSTISTTSGCGEYSTQPSFLLSSLLCHLASLLDSQEEIRPQSALLMSCRNPTGDPSQGLKGVAGASLFQWEGLFLSIVFPAVPTPVMWAQ